MGKWEGERAMLRQRHCPVYSGKGGKWRQSLLQACGNCLSSWRGALVPMLIHTGLRDIVVPVEPCVLIEWQNSLHPCFALLCVTAASRADLPREHQGQLCVSHCTKGRCRLQCTLQYFTTLFKFSFSDSYCFLSSLSWRLTSPVGVAWIMLAIPTMSIIPVSQRHVSSWLPCQVKRPQPS